MVSSGIAPRGSARRWSLPGAAALAFAVLVMLFAMPAAPASADCTTGGSSCLPGSGYTGGDVVWNCGAISNTSNCYYSGGSRLDWGWGSASADASTFVCVTGDGFFSGCSYSLARACFRASCDDQDSFLFGMRVFHTYGSGRVVHGHGKW